jgi:hypothetical protein
MRLYGVKGMETSWAMDKREEMSHFWAFLRAAATGTVEDHTPN